MRTNHATQDQVMSVPAPQYTSTWHPIPHAEVVRAVHIGAKVNGLEILSPEYCLSADGANMFATYSIHHPTHPGSLMQLGVRNSIDKSMAIGITTGTKVIVCDNMMFSGEFITFRKHTSGLELEELYSMAIQAVNTAAVKMHTLLEWQESLKQIPLNDGHMKVLTFDAMTRGALTPSKINEFRNSLNDEQRLNGETLYSWHGAGTRVCRGNSLSTIARKTSLLNDVADDYCQLMEVA